MWPAARLFGVQITALGLAMAVMFVVLSFIIWRRMRSEYEEEQILVLSAVIAIAAITGAYLGGLADMHVGQIRTSGAVVVAGVALWWWCRGKKWNVWEWADVVGKWSMSLGIVGGIAWGLGGVWYSLAMLVGFGLVNTVARKYRQVKWYRSGKQGLVGLVALAWWAGVEIAVAKYYRGEVYLPSLSSLWIPVVILVGAIGGIYVRSGHVLSEDLGELWQKIFKTKK